LKRKKINFFFHILNNKHNFFFLIIFMSSEGLKRVGRGVTTTTNSIMSSSSVVASSLSRGSASTDDISPSSIIHHHNNIDDNNNNKNKYLSTTNGSSSSSNSERQHHNHHRSSSSSSVDATAVGGGGSSCNNTTGGVVTSSGSSSPSLLQHSPSSPTSDVEQRVRHAADQQCWSTFVITCWLVFGLFVVLVWSQWNQSGGAVQTHSVEYFVLCMIGGVLSGLPHFLLTPFDHIKCRMQTGDFASAVDGFNHIWNLENSLPSSSSMQMVTATTPTTTISTSSSGGGGGAEASSFSSSSSSSAVENNNSLFFVRIAALYRGWAPTLVGYSLQGATKFGLYEYFKWALRGWFGQEFARNHNTILFLVASACAELCADVLLAPWEAIKVKIQTNQQLPSHMGGVVPRMYSLEGIYGFYKGLPPLWMRQVPYTMTKFATFEKTVEFFYNFILRAPKKSVSPGIQLVVSLASGFLAGVFCTIVSHPADTVVSKLNQKADSRIGSWQIVTELGWSGLWKGIWSRIFFIGTLTALQWLIYDSFKVMVGLSTTGGGSGAPGSVISGGDRRIHSMHHHHKS
jgi:solute carrier family 25 (mitochondrial phosphate transporter), member 3